LTPEQIREAFRLFDADGTGAIDKDEMTLAMKGLGFENVSQREVEEAIKAADRDGNGTIEYPEFESLVKDKMAQKDSEEEIRRAFKLFDLEDRGFVTLQNMKDVTKMLGETTPDHVLEQFVKEADTDGDNRLSLEEWRGVMNSMKGK